MLTRRRLLQTGATGLVSLALPLGLGRRAAAAGSDKVLVVIFLRGGADGLHMVVPTLDPEYYALRPTIQVPPGYELPLTSGFGMHPTMPELQTLFQQGELDIVHAVGSPDTTRSHFDAQDFMERGTPGDRNGTRGWLNRALGIVGNGDALAGVTLGAEKDLALAGPAQSLQLRSVSTFGMSGTPVSQRRAALEGLYDGSDLLSTRAQEAFEVLDRVGSVSLDTSAPYPGTELSSQLLEIAALVKADIGLRVATTSAHHWDTHDRQSEKAYAPMRDLSLSLSAFHQDLGSDANRVLTLVVTEFGRTAGENGALGTDHGRGSAMFALGGGVRGGRVLLQNGSWPGLDESDPFRDLPVTTDFRDVFAEVLERHMAVPDAATVLPGFVPSAARFPGLFS